MNHLLIGDKCAVGREDGYQRDRAQIASFGKQIGKLTSQPHRHELAQADTSPHTRDKDRVRGV